MKVTRLWWVRHGPTHEKAFTGWRDVPADLSDTAKIARLHSHLPPDAALISSDLQRATSTADALGAGRTRLPHAPALRELNFGVWDGLHFSKVAEMHPELSRAYWETPGDVKPPNGESWHDLSARVSPKVDALLQQDASDLIIVCHFGVVLNQLQRATGFSCYDTFAQKIDNLSVTEIAVSNNGWQTGVINHCP